MHPTWKLCGYLNNTKVTETIVVLLVSKSAAGIKFWELGACEYNLSASCTV